MSFYFYRNVAFSVCMTFGIIGTILGNLVLPTLAEVNNELSFMVHVLLHSGEYNDNVLYNICK